jgi:3-oxoacyl-[acyl-carrier-protein] synthase-1
MFCSLGPSAPDASAAARAGIRRLRELKSMSFALDPTFGKESVDPGQPPSGHVAPRPDGYSGLANLTLLGSGALSDLLRQNVLSNSDLSRCGFYLNLSDCYLQAAATFLPFEEDPPAEQLSIKADAFCAEHGGELIERVLRRTGIAIPGANCFLYYGGRAGLVRLLEDACRKMHLGSIDRCIIGGIDSCVEPTFLKSAASLNLLKTSDNPVGFIGGEAAAFLLLERMQASEASVPNARMEIVGLSYGRDKHSYLGRDLALGEGLAIAISEVLTGSQASASSPGLVIADLNGTERRAIDWSYAALRLSSSFNLRKAPVWIPALNFGETGAAIGFQALCLLRSGFQRGYIPSNDALAWFASDNGDRSAVYLTG